MFDERKVNDCARKLPKTRRIPIVRKEWNPHKKGKKKQNCSDFSRNTNFNTTTMEKERRGDKEKSIGQGFFRWLQYCRIVKWDHLFGGETWGRISSRQGVGNIYIYKKE